MMVVDLVISKMQLGLLAGFAWCAGSMADYEASQTPMTLRDNLLFCSICYD